MDQDRAPVVVRRPAGRTIVPGGRRAAVALLTLLAAGAIALAAIPALRNAEPDDAALRGLQIRVLAISQAAAENRIDGALDALAALERDLDEAAGSGLVSAARFRGIDAALEAVRADLMREADAGAAAAKAAVAAASPSPTPAPAPTVASLVPAPIPQQPGAVQEPAPVPAAKPGPPADVQEPKGKAKGAGKP
ncbi:hypothetical protein ACFWIX_08975 [Pseudarthrobacter sp. NPDC058362]|uniref:hypothetical protein n=1 Tax=unclassified Pseudarthrobacter TaxID=2647000 RepID=UPI0036471277